MDWPALLAALIGGGVITKVFDYFTTGRVDRMGKIQQVYEKTLDDADDRHEKEIARKDKRILELEGDLNIKNALLDQERQRHGELLVTIEDMKKTVNKVSDDVKTATGDFGKFPLAGESVPHGRRAGDKPDGEKP